MFGSKAPPHRLLLRLIPLDYDTRMSSAQPPSSPLDFSKAWQRSFGETPPLGHLLRHDFSDHWTRFHALPESKRYADTKEEQAIILLRANALTTRIIGDQAQVWVVTGYPTGATFDEKTLPVRMGMAEVMTSVDRRQEVGNPFELTFFACAHDWTSNSLDGLFGQIADDQEKAILFSDETQTVLAPYDGGFDIISLQPGKIRDLETKYQSWMSRRADRL